MFDKIVDFMLRLWDYPFFQRASGFVLGAVLVGLIWALRTLYRMNMVINVLAEQTKSVWSEDWNETVNEAIREEKEDERTSSEPKF